MLSGGGNPLSLKILAFIEFEKHYENIKNNVDFTFLPDYILNYFLQHTSNETLFKNILLERKKNNIPFNHLNIIHGLDFQINEFDSFLGNYLTTIKLDDCFNEIDNFFLLIEKISQTCTRLEELLIYNAIGFTFEFNCFKQLSNLKKFEFVNCKYIINHQEINDFLLILPKLE